MKGIKIWLFLLSAFPIFILFGSDLDISPEVTNIVVSILLVFPFIKYSLGKNIFSNIRGKEFPYFLFFSLVTFNIILSIDPLGSLLFWIVYLLFIQGVYSCTIYFQKKNQWADFLLILKEKVGYYLFFSSLIIYVSLVFLNFGNAKTYNTLGIITGSAFVYFWFKSYDKILYKIATLPILGYILLVSNSRSSLIIALASIGLVELILIKKNATRKLFLILSAFTVLIYFSEELSIWLVKKDLSKGLDTNSNFFLSQINEDRYVLIENFLNVYDNIFLAGYGINAGYQNLREWDIVDNIGVHNGILEMILFIGIPLSVVFLYFSSISIKKIILTAKKKQGYSAILGFTIYCFLRSYGESYFLINIGNIMSLLFIIVLVVFQKNRAFQ